MDTKALNHVLMNSYDYQKPEPIRYHLVKIFGDGVSFTLKTSRPTSIPSSDGSQVYWLLKEINTSNRYDASIIPTFFLANVLA